MGWGTKTIEAIAALSLAACSNPPVVRNVVLVEVDPESTGHVVITDLTHPYGSIVKIRERIVQLETEFEGTCRSRTIPVNSIPYTLFACNLGIMDPIEVKAKTQGRLNPDFLHPHIAPPQNSNEWANYKIPTRQFRDSAIVPGLPGQPRKTPQVEIKGRLPGSGFGPVKP